MGLPVGHASRGSQSHLELTSHRLGIVLEEVIGDRVVALMFLGARHSLVSLVM